jgi:hypothetical protein
MALHLLSSHGANGVAGTRKESSVQHHSQDRIRLTGIHSRPFCGMVDIRAYTLFCLHDIVCNGQKHPPCSGSGVRCNPTGTALFRHSVAELQGDFYSRTQRRRCIWRSPQAASLLDRASIAAPSRSACVVGLAQVYAWKAKIASNPRCARHEMRSTYEDVTVAPSRIAYIAVLLTRLALP